MTLLARDRRRERTALCAHEAGHAVVAVLLGATFDRITLHPTDPSREAELLGIDAPSVAALVMVLLAGPAAERRLAPTADLDAHAVEDETTIASLLPTAAREFDDADQGRLRQRLHTAAADLLLEHLDVVRGVADQLRRCDVLSYDEVRRAFRQPPSVHLLGVSPAALRATA